MSAECVLFLAACAVAVGSATVLVVAPRYPDGVIGRLALIAIVLGGLVVLINWWDGWQYEVQRSTLVTQIGVAGLLARRVVRMVLKGETHGSRQAHR